MVKLPITTVMSAVYAIPVFSVLFGWLILGEQPSLLTLVGGAVDGTAAAGVQRVVVLGGNDAAGEEPRQQRPRAGFGVRGRGGGRVRARCRGFQD